MRRLEVAFRPQALSDLQEIYDAVLDASGSFGIARRYVDRIVARCDRIGDVPHGGRPRDDLEPGLRGIPFEKSALIL